jgi:hypothetical protein
MRERFPGKVAMIPSARYLKFALALVAVSE